MKGREAIVEFLKRKWQKERDYKLKKYLWGFTDNRISVCFEYEYRNADGDWFRAYGNEVRTKLNSQLNSQRAMDPPLD